MTTIDVNTSPLQAAREWRGAELVAAALGAGLTVSQVEALEAGDVDVFGSIDEMLACAIVYGASLGIGRDEAAALLDRTMLGAGARVELPRGPEPAGFSEAIKARSARIADRDRLHVSVVDPMELEPIAPHVVADVELAGVAATGAADEIVHPGAPNDAAADDAAADASAPHDGPSPEQAVSASQEFAVEAASLPWEATGDTGELEAWVAAEEPRSFGAVPADLERLEPTRLQVLRARVADASYAATERLLGTDRADVVADRAVAAGDRIAAITRTGRERLRRSEHATLIVAIGGGAVLIALLVAIGGALGGGKEDAKSASSSAARSDAPAAQQSATPSAQAPGTSAKTPTKSVAPAPMVPAARLSVNVFNAGSRRGSAHSTAATVKQAGYRVGEVGNDRNGAAQSTVIYPKGLEREARVLARRVGITKLQQAPTTGTSRSLTIVIV